MRPSQPAITTNFLIAPDFTASMTLSASAKTCAWAKPPTISPFSSSFGGSHFFAIATSGEKSFVPSAFASICGQPGKPVAPVVNSRALYESFGGTTQFVVIRTGPPNASNSSFCFHHAFP